MMTSDAKKALSKTIRGLRARLIEDLREALESSYRLSVPADKAGLGEAAQRRRQRIESWIEEQQRGLGKSARQAASERLRLDIAKDAGATLLTRLVYLRLLEASGLRSANVLSGGWESAAYKTFRQLAPELVRDDASEGYATLLQLIFDDLAVELPGVFGPVRLTALLPIPPATLRAVVEALEQPSLQSVWTDDTTLGWIYQYWNDPEREALDAKLNDNKKLENHELASKTQMFTERYMVEWLLQNSLGTMWLAMCRRHGWTAAAEAKREDGKSVLDHLDERRAAFRAQREAGEVPLDALMPIEPGLEERWKYWVPQPIPQDAIDKAPDSVRAIKLLDPACGSGHFLVIACDLLFALYREEAQLRGETWTDAHIVESILAHNLYGIDIDPHAVRIAAAALMLKAKQLCAQAEPPTLNLVAPTLSLASLPEDDPARVELYDSVERETGVPRVLTARVLKALEGADHLGSLLKVDAEVERALKEWEDKLGKRRPSQGSLFEEQSFDPEQRELVSLEEARETLLDRLETFLARHSASEDLGLRLRGEQLAAGVRFLRMVREGQYDIVVGNPPYQGTSKMADAKYVQKHYPRGKADLYAAFLERGLQLAREGGVSALLTMRNWMFIKQFSALREWLLATYDLRLLGDVDRGAFDEVPNEVLSAVMSLFQKAAPGDLPSIAMQPTPLDDKSYDRERTKRKRAAVLCQVGRFEFRSAPLRSIKDAPVTYWWTHSFLNTYLESEKLGERSPALAGTQTSNDKRFFRLVHEVDPAHVWVSRSEADPRRWAARWVPCIKGAAGRRWIEPLTDLIRWSLEGLELRLSPAAYPRNPDRYFQLGIAFPKIGADFGARCHRFRSICGDAGASVFPEHRAGTLCMMNSNYAGAVLGSLNPTVNFTTSDVDRLPCIPIADAEEIVAILESAFVESEKHREQSVEFTCPGSSSWTYAQAWAQSAVDRDVEQPLSRYTAEYEPEPSTDHLSFALGVALGRFGASGEGVLAMPPSSALPDGILYLSAAREEDSLAKSASACIQRSWCAHRLSIDPQRTLRAYLAERFFPDVHRKMYENRPIYFPLSSKNKSFVAYVSIHRWTIDTLRALLAEHLYPEKQRLEGEKNDLREARQSADKKAVREAEKRFAQVDKWLDELDAFIKLVEQCAEKGPPPMDGKCKPRERDARYDPELDDGVMINAAALWPLLEPQWKDPAKWWKELANAEGKKDYDWSHLAARYFPDRVDGKCRVDPSLAVAHGCFWKYHPAKAYQWELRLQDEIGPEFKLDEPARSAEQAYSAAWVQLSSDEYRAAFENAHPDKVEELVLAEQKRREKKRKKGAESEDEQGELELEESSEEEA
jgi:hypothetical protein